MASAAALDPALLELGRSMPVTSIPEKLRCATCDKLAVNAMRLPCCENTICSGCHENMTVTECPICTHSPFEASLCVPAKSLQNTIKAFLKTEVKKRSVDQSKQLRDTPVVVTPSKEEATEEPVVHKQQISHDAQNAADSQAIDDGEQHETHAEAPPEEGDEEEDDDVVITTERTDGNTAFQTSKNAEDPTENHEADREERVQNTAEFGLKPGFEQGMNGFGSGNFNNMNGFNPMMSMQAFGMGMPNMMGMPGMGMGMGMDQSMMFNGGFGNGNGMGDMGMMGMGMGMGMGAGMGGMGGMGGFNGMAGPGFFPHQGNYMQSNFGNAPRQAFFNDRGYGRPYARGHGRGSRGGQYGRGRGGWAHQQQQQYSHHQAPYQASASAQDQAYNRRGSPTYDSMQSSALNDDSNNGVQSVEAPDSRMQDEQGERTSDKRADDTDEHAADHAANEASAERANAVDEQGAYSEGKDNEQLLSSDPIKEVVNSGSLAHDIDEQPGNHGRTTTRDPSYDAYSENFQPEDAYGPPPRGRGGFRGRSSHNNSNYARGSDPTDLTPAAIPPANAPTGPKAMRQGLPNTGWSGRAPTTTHTSTPAPDSLRPDDTYPSVVQERDSDDRSDRSHSQSYSRRRNSKHQDKVAEGNYESDEAYSRRKERERRKRKERDHYHEADEHGRASDDKKHRSRSESRTDVDSRRRRRHDKEDERRSSRSRRDRSRSKHRRRHRSRSPRKGSEKTDDSYTRHSGRGHQVREDTHAETDRVRDKERSRKRRDEDYDHDKREHSHRSSKTYRSSRDDDVREQQDTTTPTTTAGTAPTNRDRPLRPVIEPPSDELGFKIKGSKSARAAKDGNITSMAPPQHSSASNRDRANRRPSMQNPTSTPTPTSVDPYAEERARAQQDREAREAQRRQSSSSHLPLLGKRLSRGDDDEPDHNGPAAINPPRGPKNDHPRSRKAQKERRISYRYEDEIPEDDRDAGRWR